MRPWNHLTTLRVGNASNKNDDQKRNDALACRDKPMTTWAKARITGEASHSKCHKEEDCKEKRTKKKRLVLILSSIKQRKQLRKQISEKKSWNFKDSSCNFRLSSKRSNSK